MSAPMSWAPPVVPDKITPMSRLQELDAVENEIWKCIQAAGQALCELGKDGKASGKLADQHTATFMKTLNHVELEIGKHINYLTQVSTGHTHEGSSYASQKVLQMAWHRTEHARKRVSELENMKSHIGALGTGYQQQKTLVSTRGVAPSSVSQPTTPTAGQPMIIPPPPASTQVHTPQTPYSAQN